MGFRSFLQGLKPGEIGFCIASVGACSATLLAHNKIEDGEALLGCERGSLASTPSSAGRKRSEEARQAEWRRSLSHVDRLVSEGGVLGGLSTIKFYRARLREVPAGSPFSRQRSSHRAPSAVSIRSKRARSVAGGRADRHRRPDRRRAVRRMAPAAQPSACVRTARCCATSGRPSALLVEGTGRQPSVLSAAVITDSRSSCVRCVVRCMCMLHGNRLTLQGDPEALEIERTRLKLKRFWHSIEVRACRSVLHVPRFRSSTASDNRGPSHSPPVEDVGRPRHGPHARPRECTGPSRARGVPRRRAPMPLAR